MNAPTCCALHSTTCGQLDVCCRACPTERESLPQLLAAALAGTALLILFALGLA